MTPTAFVSFHSHGDRSFLDDQILALLSGDLRAQGVENELIVVALDGTASDATASEAFTRLVDALRGSDPIVYERVWDRAIVAKLRRALPGRTFVWCAGEHELEDAPADYVCRGELRDSVPALLARLRNGEHVDAQTVPRDEPPLLGLSRRARPLARHGFTPNLRPIVIASGPLPALETFAITGNAGCPYQADARENPVYAGTSIPERVGRGCAFCTTGNHYEARPPDETAAWVLEQLRYLRTHAPEITRLRLKDQNPFGYLTELVEACASAGLGGFALMLETRADWTVRNAARFERALEAAATSGIRLAPYLVGIESFSQAELDRFNKGISVQTNIDFLDALRRWKERFGDTLDLGEASFGFVLFTPWTTLADLRANLEAVGRTRFDRLRGKLLLSQARLYPDTALYWLAEHDGLLAETPNGAALTPEQRWGYFPAQPWRFLHGDVARFAKVAAELIETTGGRDELLLWRALCDLFESAERPAEVTAEHVLAQLRNTTPNPASRPQGPRTNSRHLELQLGGRCALACAPCDCRTGGAPASLERSLVGGGARLELRGAPEASDKLVEIVRAARRAGFDEIVMRTHAGSLAEPSAAKELVAHGVDSLLVPVFSHVAAVHDRVTGKSGALVSALVGMRAAVAAGLAVELEVPLMPAHLQSLTEIVELASRALGSGLRGVRFQLPRRAVPAAIAPPIWPEGAARLAEALTLCRALGIAAVLPESSAIPLCALRSHPELDDAFRVNPRGRARVSGCEKPGPCAHCAAASWCPGIAASYSSAHGSEGIAPYDSRPKRLLGAGKRLRIWSDAQRASAQKVGMLVLRPTVNCNQDCVFCSANETTGNVWPNPGDMMRAIARAAARGVKRVSFSGGEPTLSKHLVDYVAVAKRAGIFSIELVTNGVLIDQEKKVSALREAGLNHAFVSLHAHDEALSSAMTQKRGDWARTMRAIELLDAAGVQTVINHVVNARNFRYLTRFVEVAHERFGAHVLVNFAFVTPQFKALENLELVPRMSEAMPHLRRAMRRAVELGVPFRIGSRQGVPPCQLGEFEAWSDVLELAHEAVSEDAPQKQRAPRCDECKYTQWCTGLWKAYVTRYGLDELAPLAGPSIDADERTALLRHPLPGPWEVPLAFDQVPQRLRRPELETEPTPELQRASDEVPSYASALSRPLRVLIVGSGARARALARAAREVAGLSVDAVASPHAPDGDLGDFGNAPAYRDAREAMLDIRPDAVIIASATRSHFEIVQVAAALGIPALVEKPLARTEEEAEELSRMEGPLMVPAHSDLHAPGLQQLWARGAVERLMITRRCAPDSSDAPAAWSRRALYESLYHLTSLAVRGCGAAGPIEVRNVVWRGEQRPERVHAEMAFGQGAVEFEWEASGHDDELVIAATCGEETVRWRRAGATFSLETGGHSRKIERSTGELAGMLEAFRDAVRGERAPEASRRDAVATMRATRLLLEALEAAGAPLQRAGAPTHVSSRDVREDPA